VSGVADEAAPGPGDALEAAERLGRQPREDLDDQLVREVGHRRWCSALHASEGWWNLQFWLGLDTAESEIEQIQGTLERKFDKSDQTQRLLM
jgi:hypothetical protein